MNQAIDFLQDIVIVLIYCIAAIMLIIIIAGKLLEILKKVRK